MRAVRRTTVMLAMLLAVAMAVPASAAAWQTAASAVGQGDGENHQSPFTSITGSRRDVAEIQIGFKTYGRTRTVEYSYDVACWNNGDYASKYRSDLTRSVEPGAYRWVTVWSRTRRDVCDVGVTAYMSNSSTLRTKIRVR